MVAYHGAVAAVRGARGEEVMTGVPRSRRRRSAAGLVALALGACASRGEFLWVDQVKDLAPPTESEEYLIGAGDLLFVRVWNQEGISGRSRVRVDGKISFPFLNDVDAAGIPPQTLARRIQTRLKDYIVNPVVTVSVEEPRPSVVSVVGEVAKPGVYPIDRTSGVLQALAAAGGLTETADREGVFVLRKGYWADGSPSPVRIRFTLRALERAEGKAATFRLKPGDTVVVE